MTENRIENHNDYVKALPIGGGIMEGDINMNGKKLSGLNAPTEGTEAATKGYTLGLVKRAAPRNLLDNSDFRNPVNQRGQTSYTLGAWGGYCIDRWRAGDRATTLTVNDNNCTLSGEIYQTIDQSGNAKDLNGKTITIAAKVNDSIACRIGNIELTGVWTQFADFSITGGRVYIYADSSNNIHVGLVTDDTVTIEWVALYEGEYTADTLPEYQPKGYGAELVECKRYYKKRSYIRAVAAWDNLLIATDRYEIDMRTSPTISHICAYNVLDLL